MSPQKKAAFAVTLVLFGLFAALPIAEAILRIRETRETAGLPSQPNKAVFWEQQQDFGWIHPSEAEGMWFNNANEFAVKVRMNSKGLRDVEHDYTKPPGTFRILLLGDSYMEGMQVEEDQLFARRLEAKLNDGGRQVEVINSGVADWGTDNELVYFRTEGYKYSPDLVLLAFTTANDLRNNSVELNRSVPTPNLHKPTFTLDANGALEFHETPPPFPAAARTEPTLWRESRVLSLFADRLGLSPPLPTLQPPPSPGTAATVPPKKSNVATDMLVYAPVPSPEVLRAWKVTKALIVELKNDVERHGAKFAMFTVNGPWAHYDEPWRLMLIGDSSAQRSWNRRRPNDELGLFVWEKKILSLDLFQPFESKKNDTPLFFQKDPHWTPAGHEVAAEAVAQFLVKQKLVPAGQP